MRMPMRISRIMIQMQIQMQKIELKRINRQQQSY